MKSFKALLFALIAIVSISSCTRIDAANEGILVNQFGDSKGNALAVPVSGTVFYNPFTQDVFEYPTHIRTVDYDAFSVNAKDGSVFQIDPIVSYSVIRGKSGDIFKKFRLDIGSLESGVLRNYVKDAFKNVFNTYTTDGILSQRQAFDAQVTALLRSELTKEGFYVDNLTFGMAYPQTITAAIERKNSAVQDAEAARNQLVKDSIQARRQVIVAQGEAEANRLRQQTLNSLLIQQQFIEKWDGHTPLYGSAPVNFNNVNK